MTSRALKRKSNATARTKGKKGSRRRSTKAARAKAPAAPAPPEPSAPPPASQPELPAVATPVATPELVEDPADVALEAADKSEQPFLPSKRQILYLQKVRELAEEGERPTDVRVSELLKLSRTTIWEWRQNPRFVQWFTDSMQGVDDIEWRAAIARHVGLAIVGSVRSFEAIARVRSIGVRGGGFTPEGGGGNAQIQVNILIPRPPDDAALPAGGGQA